MKGVAEQRCLVYGGWKTENGNRARIEVSRPRVSSKDNTNVYVSLKTYYRKIHISKNSDVNVFTVKGNTLRVSMTSCLLF